MISYFELKFIFLIMFIPILKFYMEICKAKLHKDSTIDIAIMPFCPTGKK